MSPGRPRKFVATLSAVALTLYALAPAGVKAATVSTDNWSMSYTSSAADGTILTNAQFNGTTVFARASLPYVRVYYEEVECCIDNLGGSYRKSGPTFVDFSGGFRIESTYCFGTCTPFDASNTFAYKYVERYSFYSTGLWLAQLLVYGPGLYPTALYETLWRIDYDIAGPGGDTLETYAGGSWVPRITEAQYCDDGANDPAGNEWRQTDPSPLQRYLVDPRSTLPRYCDLALLFHGVEMTSDGEADPTVWDTNESIASADIVQWYRGYWGYSRPAGCAPDGNGCSTSFSIYFYGNPAGY